MKVTNHLELEMFGILEDPQTLVCIKLKGNVSFLFLIENGTRWCFASSQTSIKIIGFSFVKQCGKHFFQNEERWGSQPFMS